MKTGSQCLQEDGKIYKEYIEVLVIWCKINKREKQLEISREINS